jgi:hypothetical protein
VWEVNVEEEYHEEATSSVKEKFIAEKEGRVPGSHGTGRDAPVIKREVIDAHKPDTSGGSKTDDLAAMDHDAGTEIAGEPEA